MTPVKNSKRPLPDEKFLRDNRFLVTGGNGFLGKHLIAELHSLGVEDEQLFAPDSSTLDLRDPGEIRWWLDFFRPTVIIHAAAVVGGIGANSERPGEFFYENIIMGVQLMELARQVTPGVKFVTIGTVCEYPKDPPNIPFLESDIWSGYPEETNASYGIAKKALLVQGQAYRKQYGFNAIHLLPTNMYGPGDDFDDRTSHVIPALIKRIVNAKKQRKPSVTIWGTGNATRDFLFVKDSARAIVKATLGWNEAAPLNIGSGEEVSIARLVSEIVHIVGYDGLLIWDAEKPDGQPRRLLDTSKAQRVLNWGPKWTLKTGLQDTINWYLTKDIPGQMVMPLWDELSDKD
jgi:GDP-L-fucose synthase